MGEGLFETRRSAGRMLAARLGSIEAPVVVAVPHGGVPVGVEVARVFRTELCTSAVRRIVDPPLGDVTLGATCADGPATLNADVLRTVGLSKDDVAPAMARARRRANLDRLVLGRYEVTSQSRHRPLVIADDAVATGCTALVVACRARTQGFVEIVVAAPVVSRYAANRLDASGLRWVALLVDDRPGFTAAAHYADFADVPRHAALSLLSSARVAPVTQTIRKDEGWVSNGYH